MAGLRILGDVLHRLEATEVDGPFDFSRLPGDVADAELGGHRQATSLRTESRTQSVRGQQRRIDPASQFAQVIDRLVSFLFELRQDRARPAARLRVRPCLREQCRRHC